MRITRLNKVTFRLILGQTGFTYCKHDQAESFPISSETELVSTQTFAPPTIEVFGDASWKSTPILTILPTPFRQI